MNNSESSAGIQHAALISMPASKVIPCEGAVTKEGMFRRIEALRMSHAAEQKLGPACWDAGSSDVEVVKCTGLGRDAVEGHV